MFFKCVYDMQSMTMKKSIELNQPEKQLPNNLSPTKKKQRKENIPTMLGLFECVVMLKGNHNK